MDLDQNTYFSPSDREPCDDTGCMLSKVASYVKEKTTDAMVEQENGDIKLQKTGR